MAEETGETHETAETVETEETEETIETVETVETLETVKTVETLETLEAVETVQTEDLKRYRLLTTRKQEMLAHLKRIHIRRSYVDICPTRAYYHAATKTTEK